MCADVFNPPRLSQALATSWQALCNISETHNLSQSLIFLKEQAGWDFAGGSRVGGWQVEIKLSWQGKGWRERARKHNVSLNLTGTYSIKAKCLCVMTMKTILERETCWVSKYIYWSTVLYKSNFQVLVLHIMGLLFTPLNLHVNVVTSYYGDSDLHSRLRRTFSFSSLLFFLSSFFFSSLLSFLNSETELKTWKSPQFEMF